MRWRNEVEVDSGEVAVFDDTTKCLNCECSHIRNERDGLEKVHKIQRGSDVPVASEKR